MAAPTNLEVGASKEAIHRDASVALGVETDRVDRGEVLDAVRDEVGMFPAPGKRAKLCYANEPRQVEDLTLQVLAVLDTRQVEQFGTIIDFRPKALLQMVGMGR